MEGFPSVANTALMMLPVTAVIARDRQRAITWSYSFSARTVAQFQQVAIGFHRLFNPLFGRNTPK